MSNKIVVDFGPFLWILGVFWGLVTLWQVKKQQIKDKLWIWGPITVYYNRSCAQIFFLFKNHSTLLQYIAVADSNCACGQVIIPTLKPEIVVVAGMQLSES